MFLAEVFLNYSQQDKSIADRLAHDLHEAGVEVWSDEIGLSPGDLVAQNIDKALRRSQNYISIVSKSSSKSNWFNSELATAIAAVEADPNRKLIPILVEEGAEIPPFLRQRKYIQMIDEESYSVGLSQLIDSLEQSQHSKKRQEPKGEFSREFALRVTEQLEVERAYHEAMLKIRLDHRSTKIHINGIFAILAGLLGVLGAFLGFTGVIPTIETSQLSSLGKTWTFIAGTIGGVILSVFVQQIYIGIGAKNIESLLRKRRKDID